MPNFFASDIFYDAVAAESDILFLELKPMFVELIRGYDGILSLIWDGSVDSNEGGKMKIWDLRKVELRVEGEGATRSFTSAKMEFRGKPLYVGMISGKGVWQEMPVSEHRGLKHTFDAVWRTNSVSENIVVYPFDRTEKTPIDKFVVEDLLRQALGGAPCDLDWWRDILK